MALPSNKYPYRETEPIPEDTPKVRGYDFNQGVDYQKLLQSFLHTGFQATHVAMAIQQIIKMVRSLGHEWIISTTVSHILIHLIFILTD